MGHGHSKLSTSRRSSSSSFVTETDSPPPYTPRRADVHPRPAPSPPHLNVELDIPRRALSATPSHPRIARAATPDTHRRAASSVSLHARQVPASGSSHAWLSGPAVVDVGHSGCEILLVQSRNGRLALTVPAPPPRPSSAPPRQRSTTASSANTVRQADVRITVTRTPPASARIPIPTQISDEDPLIVLKKYDTVIIVDDSSSMRRGLLWQETRNALAGVVETAANYDIEGIALHFLNHSAIGVNLQSAAEVNRLFDRVIPRGFTPTAEKLEKLLLDYLDKLENWKGLKNAGTVLPPIRPVNFILLTDGAPSDDPASVIVAAARRLDAGNFPLSQVGLQFVQIGTDPQATAALKELDDELAAAHGIRDIVDTTLFSGTPLTPDLLGKILIGGINRRMDKRVSSNANV